MFGKERFKGLVDFPTNQNIFLSNCRSTPTRAAASEYVRLN